MKIILTGHIKISKYRREHYKLNINIKKSLSSKDTIMSVKTYPNIGRRYLFYILGRGLISEIYK
jgi:hypothetical protein